jgi:hypothetical protein
MQRRTDEGTRTVPVPDHDELRTGTLLSIIRQSSCLELCSRRVSASSVFALPESRSLRWHHRTARLSFWNPTSHPTNLGPARTSRRRRYQSERSPGPPSTATKWHAAESHRGSDQRRRIERLDHNVSPGIKAPA